MLPHGQRHLLRVAELEVVRRLRAFSVMIGQHLLRASAIFLLLASHSFAHRPYEHPAGTFQRGDGIVLSIVEHYVDGIIAADPVSIQFRLPDGTEVARTEYVSDAALRRSREHIDVYQFETTFFPVAERVQRFDGYSLSDVTSPAAVRVSPLVHTAFHWRGYLIGLGVAAFVVAAWFAIRGMPRRGWFAAIRALGFLIVVLFSLIYLLMLLYGPISPIILAAFGALSTFIYVLVRNRFRQSTVAEPCAAANGSGLSR